MNERPRSAALGVAIVLGFASFSVAVVSIATDLADLDHDRYGVSPKNLMENLFVLLVALSAALVSAGSAALATSKQTRQELRRLVLRAGVVAFAAMLFLLLPFWGRIWYYALDPAHSGQLLRIIVLLLAVAQPIVLLVGAAALNALRPIPDDPDAEVEP